MLYKNLKDLQHVKTSPPAYTPFMPSHLSCYGPFVISSESPQDNLIRHKLEHKWVSPHNLMTNKKSFTHFLYGNPSIPPGYSDSHHSHLSRRQKDYSWFIHMSKQMTTLDSFLLSDLKSLSQWPKSTFFPNKFSLCSSNTFSPMAILDRNLRHLFLKIYCKLFVWASTVF